MKCFYHKSDLDGHCSGAIVKYFNPECELIGVEYGDMCPIETIGLRESVFIVDFSWPMADLLEIRKQGRLVWIDHHKSAIDQYEYWLRTEQRLPIMGLRDISKAACELTWGYFIQEPLPEVVRLLGRYDVWDHKDEKVLPFQMGIRLETTSPEENFKLWQELFQLKKDSPDIKNIISRGEIILEYQKQCDKRNYDRNLLEIDFDGVTVPCLNSSGGSEKFLDTLKDVPFGILFHRTKDKWVVSLRSENIDVSLIAKRYGGGGHKGAAGFTCEKLPFEV